MIADLTPIQRSAVRLAVRGTRRIWIDADDREQDAAEAVLRARLDETRTDAEQAAYLARRAVGAILDAARAQSRDALTYRQWLDDADAAEVGLDLLPDSAAGPEQVCAMHERLRAIDAMPDPLPRIARRVLEGDTVRSIAAEMGVGESSVSQRLAQIIRELGAETETEPWIDWAAAPTDAAQADAPAQADAMCDTIRDELSQLAHLAHLYPGLIRI